MYERIRDSLIYPENIIHYRKDSMFRILFILLLYSTIMSLSVIVDTATFDSFNVPTKDYLEEQYISENVPCVFEDQTLSCTEDVNELVLNYQDALAIYIFSGETIDYSSFDESNVNMIFKEDEIILLSFGSPVSVPTTELFPNFGDIDFTNIENDPEQFHQALTLVIEDAVLETKALWAPIVIAMYLLINLMFALFIAIITAVIIRSRYKMIPFRETFRFAVYMSTATYLVLGVLSMVGGFFLFIFAILIINSRQMGRLVNAIDAVIKK